MIETLTRAEFSAAFARMRWAAPGGNKRFPHSIYPIPNSRSSTEMITKDEWDGASYNPLSIELINSLSGSRDYLIGLVDTSPLIYPKPTWDEVIAYKLTTDAADSVATAVNELGNHADPIASAPILHSDSGHNIQFKNVDSLTGLVHLHAKYSQSGSSFEPVHFPSADNPKETVALSLFSELDAFITATAENKNRAESARNLVSATLHSLLEQIQTVGIADDLRETLADQIRVITDDPKAAIRAKIVEVYGDNPPVIPRSIERARKGALEEIERVGALRQMQLRIATTPQGVHLPFASSRSLSVAEAAVTNLVGISSEEVRQAQSVEAIDQITEQHIAQVAAVMVMVDPLVISRLRVEGDMVHCVIEGLHAHEPAIWVLMDYDGGDRVIHRVVGYAGGEYQFSASVPGLSGNNFAFRQRTPYAESGAVEVSV